MHLTSVSATEAALLVVFFVCVASSVSDAALFVVKSAAVTLLDMESPSEYAIATALLFVAYLAQYLLFSGLFEATHPAPKTERRVKEIKKEIQLGVGVTLINIVFATTWMYFVDPHLPYYGYFETHPYTLKEFLFGFAVYFFFADTWFYWTHRMLHLKFFWRNVHYLHHSFIEPTAFAQDAVHWFEAVIQGPCGHFLAALIYPMHPVFLAGMGFFTAIYAIAAHDGRALDLNDHTKHHTHKMGYDAYEIKGVNFGLYWGFWDHVCGTRYDPAKSVPWNPHKDAADRQLLSGKDSITKADAVAAAGAPTKEE
eukprot:Unigene1956_Nuclearia_a/m.6089 Unigene1956_Nuclearia_a/g.6089  ORF Unigene1956_Nuclearia_a/g.6089 Unigene1956_Nuclearia_a/m.6089 type:complete len:311 (-) Unigene1956_Nuclearia_a:212-1144(-)